MLLPQTGIFALGDGAHQYLELRVKPGVSSEAVVRAVADLRPPHTTVGGVNLVTGFRPELWRSAAPDDIPADVRSFGAPMRGPDGFTMPATQGDVFLWIAGAAYDLVFDVARGALRDLAAIATLEREVAGWSYRHSRDLTGFEDGTENPSLFEAPDAALVAEGPGAGGSILLFQKWRHESSFHELPEHRQEGVIGRTKAESTELDDDAMPPDSHVARTKFVEDGDELPIFRRNTPYGTVSDHGTVFVGFSCEQRRLDRMLAQMAGLDGGPRDALTRYTTPLSGAYYFVPALEALRRFASAAAAEPPPPTG